MPIAASPSTEDMERFLAWRVLRAGREVERALTRTIAEHELTITQFGVLSLLATGGDFTHDLTAAGEQLIEHAWPHVTDSYAPVRLGLNEGDTHTLDRLRHTLERAAGRDGRR